MAKPIVAVLRVTPENILDDTARVCELAGVSRALDASATTLVSAQVTRQVPLPAANTTPWQLEGAILGLRRAGLHDITRVRSTPGPHAALRRRGRDPYAPILEQHGVPVVESFAPADTRWVEYRPRARLHVLHEIFPEGLWLPSIFFGRNAVLLPTAQSDPEVIIAGAMKSAARGLLGLRGQRSSGRLARALVDLLAIQREIQSGMFALMDATTVRDRRRPSGSVPVVKDLMLASADPVALDAVAAKLMGFEPLEIEAIRLAHEDGLGVGDPVGIEVVGDDVSGQNWAFSAGDDSEAGLAGPRDVEWLERVRRRARRTSLGAVIGSAMAAGNEIYEDQYRWRREERAPFERWKTETRWGQLFARYGRGPLGQPSSSSG